MMITGSVVFFKETIQPIQVIGKSTHTFKRFNRLLLNFGIGYSITLAGLYLFKVAGGK
jgi:hypothetical protein